MGAPTTNHHAATPWAIQCHAQRTYQLAPATKATRSNSAVIGRFFATDACPELARPARSGIRAPGLERGESIANLVDDLHARDMLAQAARHFAARPQSYRRRQLAAQRSQRVADLTQGESHRERERHYVNLVGKRRPPDILERRLGAKRNAIGALRRKECLDHQQTNAMLLARHGGKQNSRHAGWTRKRVDGAAQGELQLFGVQMLLEYLQLAAHPGLAHGAIERGDRLDDEALDPLALQQIRQRRMESGRVVCFEKSKD